MSEDIAEIERLRAMLPRWIPVAEQLPPRGLVLACSAKHGVLVLAGWVDEEKAWSVPEWINGANRGCIAWLSE